MNRRATFGDFASSATQHLRRLQWARPSAADRANAADVIADLRRAVRALAGYADDVSRTLERQNVDRQLGVWVRATARTGEGLVAAEAALSVPRTEEGASKGGPSWEFDDLRAATRSMALGRDLLHTHDSVGAAHVARSGSEWTSVVSSAPVAGAVLHEAGGWTRHIAGYAYRMSSTASYPPAERRALSEAGKALTQVSWAIGAAQEQRPVRHGQLRMLHAIPVNAIPDPRLPASSDTVADLTAGAISTAERLRVAARRASAEAPWSRRLTRETLRQTAGCCAISASNMQILLSTLAAQHGTSSPPASAAITEAAEAADRARAAWLAVTESWSSITTDTRGVMGPTGTEATALALWTGRLAYTNPGWTPNLGPRHQPRPAGELAGDMDELRAAVDAAHHVGHTLTQVAEADREHLRAAAMAGRLIVPTRSLPDEYDVPYRFAPAPPSHTAPLLSTYTWAQQASEDATSAIADVAAQIQADSRILKTARAAARGDPSAWAGQPVSEPPADLGRGQERGPPPQRASRSWRRPDRSSVPFSNSTSPANPTSSKRQLLTKPPTSSSSAPPPQPGHRSGVTCAAKPILLS